MKLLKLQVIKTLYMLTAKRSNWNLNFVGPTLVIKIDNFIGPLIHYLSHKLQVKTALQKCDRRKNIGRVDLLAGCFGFFPVDSNDLHKQNFILTVSKTVLYYVGILELI